MQKRQLRARLSSLVCAVTILASLSLPYVQTAQAIRPYKTSTLKASLEIGDDPFSLGKGQKAGRSIPGEVIVKFKSEAAMERTMAASRAISDSQTLQFSSESDIEAILSRHNVRMARPLLPPNLRQNGLAIALAQKSFSPLGRVVRLISSSREDEVTHALMLELSRHPEVEYVAPNMTYELDAVPQDPYYSSSGSWGQDFMDMWGLHKINVEQAWEVSEGEGVVVAVIDTGVDFKHKEIKKNIWNNAGEIGRDSSGRDKSSNGVDDDGNGYVDDWHGWDFQDHRFGDVNDKNPHPPDNNPMDEIYHGTHVAGTIAAQGNKKGVIGVAPKAKIMPLKTFAVVDGASQTNSVSLAEAIIYAANNGARVINASWGGSSSAPDRPVEEAINYAVDVKGVVIVVSAGNSNLNVEDSGIQQPLLTFPAASEKVITVGASDHLDHKSFFSNFGPKIDVIAPGGGDSDPSKTIPLPEQSILSLLSSKASLNETGQKLVLGGKYFRLAGTSMSAPHVSGLAALILSKNPNFTVEQVRQAIRLGADDMETAGFDSTTGYGRINAARSLAVVNPPAPSINDVKSSQNGAGVNIFSTIADPHFTQWTLEYGEAELGGMPSSWTQIATSAEITNKNLQTLWNTANVPDGVYVLRLRVEDIQGRQLDDRTRIGVQSGKLAPTRLFIKFGSFQDLVEPEDNNRVRQDENVAVHLALIFPYFKLPSKVELLDRGQRVADLILDPVLTLRNARNDYATREDKWIPGPVGSAELTIMVEGENGEKFISHPRRVTIVPNSAPALFGFVWEIKTTVPGTFDLTVSSIDPDGNPPPIPQLPPGGTHEGLVLEVFNNDQLIGTAIRNSPSPTSNTHHFKWENLDAGTYSIRVVATDKDGYSTRSLPINFAVAPPQ